MYKVTYNLVAIPASNNLVHNTRQSRHNHLLAYRQIPTLRDYYKYTCFPRIIIHWNALPAYIPILPTLEQFMLSVRWTTHPHKRPIFCFYLLTIHMLVGNPIGKKTLIVTFDGKIEYIILPMLILFLDMWQNTYG